MSAAAQVKYDGVLQVDREVHDFGDISVDDGPVSCSYTLVNISDKTLRINSVVSSCGCTDVKWTREDIAPGKSGTVTATYKNDSGPYPFDKTLTVYCNTLKRPVILHLRGSVHSKKLSLEELYPVRYGSLAFRDAEIKGGNMLQGQQKSGEVKVANLSKSPLSVNFNNVSDGLSLSVSPNPIPPREVATLSYTVNSDRSRWGKNWYYATPLSNGSPCRSVGVARVESSAPGAESIVATPNPKLSNGTSEIGIWAITKENFGNLTKAEKANGSNPFFTSSTFTAGKIKAGVKVKPVFEFSNVGKSNYEIYKIDVESPALTVDKWTRSVKPGAKGSISAVLDTSGLPEGEFLFIISVVSNSPLRPMLNLYVSGFIEK